MLNLRTPRLGRPFRQRGLSLIEMMVGITIGMIVVAGASVMLTQQLAEHRRLVLETQIQQDLRAASDLILRELRRGGAHAVAERLVWAPGSGIAAPITNDYAKQTAVPATQNQVIYSYSSHDDRGGPNPLNPEDNLSANNERFGFRVSNQTLQFMLGNGNWQPLTDPQTLLITNFTIQQQSQSVSLIDSCEISTCPAGSATCPPLLQVKRFDISLTGKAAHDDQVRRTLKVSSRMRNDEITGACP
ncbi:PilW family protein [Roseateles sp. PN1]|uniref:PilW family protein n=1 Tax=Roseateles sp. PN1 TaxID=3137372 RepID=UPI003139D823